MELDSINLTSLINNEGKVTWQIATKESVLKKVLKSVGNPKVSKGKFGFGGEYFAPPTLEKILVVLIQEGLILNSCTSQLGIQKYRKENLDSEVNILLLKH